MFNYLFKNKFSLVLITKKKELTIIVNSFFLRIMLLMFIMNLHGGAEGLSQHP